VDTAVADWRPQQLWFEVDRPIQVRPDRHRAARAASPSSAAASMPAQMELRMAAPVSRAAPAPSIAVTAPAPLAPAPPVPPVILEEPMSPSFASWLLDQTARKGIIGELAKAARTDRQFPKKGSADDVRARFSAVGADGDAFEALDDAEREYDRLAS